MAVLTQKRVSNPSSICKLLEEEDIGLEELYNGDCTNDILKDSGIIKGGDCAKILSIAKK